MFLTTGVYTVCVLSFSIIEPLYDYRRPNIYFNITSPSPGTFIIALHYKGREKAILEMDLNIDDLLEKVNDLPFDMKWSLTMRVLHSKKTTNIFWT